VAVNNLELLRRLPLSFVPLLLRELIEYDWNFPAERQELNAQFVYPWSSSRIGFSAEARVSAKSPASAAARPGPQIN